MTDASLADASVESLFADAGALQGLAGDRHQARWAVAAVETAQLPLFANQPTPVEAEAALPAPSLVEEVFSDYATLGTTLDAHPLALLRGQLSARKCLSSKALAGIKHGRNVSVAGLVVGRQRPGTASGVTFVTLEDEHGNVNVVVWRDLAERQRKALVGSQLLQVDGRLESEGGVCHLIARRLHDLTPMLNGVDIRSRDFH